MTANVPILSAMVVLALILRVSAQTTPEIQIAEVNPIAIFSDGIDETTISVRVSGPTESVIVRPHGFAVFCPLTIDGVSADSVELFDDGTHGDSVAGDLVFTRSGFTARCAETRREAINIKSDAMGLNSAPYYVVDPMEGDIDVIEMGPTVRRSRHIVNLQDDAGLFRPFPQWVDVQALARQFYEYFPDDYDFLAILSTVKDETAPFFNVSAKNEVQGIGSSLFEDTTSYGSAGRLQGVSWIGGPYGIGVLYHELIHQWGVFLDESLELRLGVHWGAVDIPGRLFGLDFEANGDGSFTITRDQAPSIPINGRFQTTPYPPMELYLMGLVPPEEVPPMTVLRGIDPETVRRGSVVRPTGTRVVEIGEVIEVHGPRIPDHTSSQKKFRLAGVLVTSGRLATKAEMVVFDRFLRDFSSDAESLTDESGRFLTIPFRAATGGRATIETAITIGAPLRPPVNFPHFANGDGIISEVVLVNVGATSTSPALYFYDQEGHPIAPSSVVDVTGDMEIQQDGSLTVRTGMEPLGEVTISTHGRGKLVTGSVRVVSDVPLGGVLRYDLPGIGVAGVGASPPVRDALFPARRQAGGIRTAAAIHNPGEEAMEVTCRLMKEGEVLEEAQIPVAANGQQARFIEEIFTGTDTSDFVGSVRCTAPQGGMFTGVAVELDAGNRIFTTLPVVPVSDGRGGATALNFPHFANGDGIISEVVLVNVGAASTSPSLYFYDQEGHPIAPSSVVDVRGDMKIQQDGSLTVRTGMEPLGEVTISTHGRGKLVTGSVKVVSDVPLGGVLRYDLPGIGVAGVGASPPVRDALFPARRQAGEIRTAAAIHNPGEEAMEVTCRLMKEGEVLEEASIPVAANGQQARFIEEIFTGTDTSDFVGSVNCTAPQGGTFTGVAVELDAGNRIFTTLPVVPVEEKADRE